MLTTEQKANPMQTMIDQQKQIDKLEKINEALKSSRTMPRYTAYVSCFTNDGNHFGHMIIATNDLRDCVGRATEMISNKQDSIVLIDVPLGMILYHAHDLGDGSWHETVRGKTAKKSIRDHTEHIDHIVKLIMS